MAACVHILPMAESSIVHVPAALIRRMGITQKIRLNENGKTTMFAAAFGKILFQHSTPKKILPVLSNNWQHESVLFMFYHGNGAKCLILFIYFLKHIDHIFDEKPQHK